MPEKPPKRNKTLTVCAVALALVCGVLIGLLLPKLKDVRLFGSRDAMRCEEKGFRLSQTEFSYYYWSEYYYFRDVYGGYLGEAFDAETPLSEQPYSETQTWQDYMTERAVTSVRETMSMVFAAQDADYEMSDAAKASLDSVKQNFRDAAEKQGFESLDAYLADSFGKGAEEQSFFEYLEYAHLASDYAEHLKAQIAVTDEIAAAYYEAHKDAYASEEDPLAAAKRDYIDEEYRNVFLSVTEGCTFEVDYKNIAAGLSAADKTAEKSAESVKK